MVVVYLAVKIIEALVLSGKKFTKSDVFTDFLKTKKTFKLGDHSSDN